MRPGRTLSNSRPNTLANEANTMMGFEKFDCARWSLDGLTSAGRGANLRGPFAPRSEVWPWVEHVGPSTACPGVVRIELQATAVTFSRPIELVPLVAEEGAVVGDAVPSGFWDRQLRALRAAPALAGDGDEPDGVF